MNSIEKLRASDDITKGGVKKDQGKLRWSLLPWDAVEKVVEVLEFGAKKYDDRNWEKGMGWSRLFDADMRHKVDWWQKGEHSAKDSKIAHLAHSACDILFLLAYELRNVGRDDRPNNGTVVAKPGRSASASDHTDNVLTPMLTSP